MKKELCYAALLCFFALGLFVPGAMGQAAVNGTVTDAQTGEPLVGVSVSVKGTSVAASSDVDGQYQLQGLPSLDGVLEISYLGYKTVEISLQGRTTIDVALEPDWAALEEVVVVGYGKQSRETLTTSIASIGKEEFARAPGANPLLQLQGKVAGVSLQVSNGQPGSNPQIFIRGGSSTSPDSDPPLLIVDGVVGAMRNISDLNPDDIESMQVLKDAASTAIYGARAANGVIIVTTKSGVSGKPVVNFKVTTGLEQLAKRYNFTSARDYLHVSRLNTMNYNTTNPELFLSGGTFGMSTGNLRNSRNTTEFLDMYLQNYGQDYVNDLLTNQGWETMEDPVTGKQLIFKETNYQDMTFRNAHSQQYDFNISGGHERATYYLGLGHVNQDGIVSGSYYKNYNVLFNGSYQLSDKLTMRTNMAYQVRSASSPWNYQNVLSRSVTMPFTYRDYYEDGSPAPGEGLPSFRSRHFEVFYKEKYDDVKVYRTTLSLAADYDILPGLRFSPAFYWYTTEGVENYFEAANETNLNRNASAHHNLIKKAQADALLTYAKTLGQSHNLNAVLGASYINDYTFNMNGSGRNAPTDYIPTLNATEPETQRITTTKATDIIMSYFGRVNYDFDAKYLFSASFRVDGSSRFAADHRWGLFPGLSAGWNIHREDFWDPMRNVVSRLKMRGSWGKTGNNTLTIANSQGAYGTGYAYGGEVGVRNTTLANANLVWETTTSFDAGLDIGLFDNKINLVLDYYDKTTSDRLFDKPLWSSTGFGSIRSNFGTIRNRGFEVELGSIPISTRDFSWDLNFTFAFNRGTVVKLPENAEDKNRTGGNWVWDEGAQDYVKVGGFAEGERFGQRWAYQMIGVYATDGEAANAPSDVDANGRQKVGGDAIWLDKDGNGIIDNRDMVFMGYIRPDKTGGMVNTFRYKDLTMRFVVDYAIGHVIDNSFRGRTNGSARNNNMTLTDVLSDQIWKQQGDIATIPRYTVQSDADYNFRNHLRPAHGLGSSGYTTNNSLYYSKGDFLAFREVSLGYRLRSKFLQRASIQGVELFAGVFNLGYITAYDGMMPEIYDGQDEGEYPRPRQYNFGLTLTF